jgi:hypothetical protein
LQSTNLKLLLQRRCLWWKCLCAWPRALGRSPMQPHRQHRQGLRRKLQRPARAAALALSSSREDSRWCPSGRSRAARAC